MKRILLALSCLVLLVNPEALFAQKKSRTKATTQQSKSAFGTLGQYPESTDRLLTEKDVENATPWGLKVMQNEIYARHDYMFKEADLKAHFRKEKWYKGKERNMKKVKLTDTEKQNVAFLKAQQPKL